MLELIPASAIIAIVVIALIVIFLAVGYVKAPPDKHWHSSLGYRFMQLADTVYLQTPCYIEYRLL